MKSWLMYKKQNLNGTSASLSFYHPPPSKRNFPNPSNKTLHLKTCASVCLCVLQGRHMYNQTHINQQLMSIKNKINFPWLSQNRKMWSQKQMSESPHETMNPRPRQKILFISWPWRGSPLHHKTLMKLTCSSQ